METIIFRDPGFFTHPVCIILSIYKVSELAGSCDVLVNCTGLGARQLLGDTTVTPVRGQASVSMVSDGDILLS